MKLAIRKQKKTLQMYIKDGLNRISTSVMLKRRHGYLRCKIQFLVSHYNLNVMVLRN